MTFSFMSCNLELNAALWMNEWMDGWMELSYQYNIQDFFHDLISLMRNTITKYVCRKLCSSNDNHKVNIIIEEKIYINLNTCSVRE